MTLTEPSPYTVARSNPYPTAAPSTASSSVEVQQIRQNAKQYEMRIFAYFIIAVLISPLTYRLWYTTWTAIKYVIHEREHISDGSFVLSPVSFIERNRTLFRPNNLYIMDGDYVQTIPDTIGNISSLKELYITNNPIKTVPKTIGNLSSLRRLFIRNTLLETLPEEIAQNTNITDMQLQGNAIRRLPDSIGSLQKLETLNLAYNRLTALPDSVGSLNNLTLLDLTGNNLSSFPTVLPPNLDILYIGKNPIPKKELVAAQERFATSSLVIYY